MDKIGASTYIKSVIRDGYFIPFIHTPVSVCLKNNQSALENMPFVLDAVSELLISGRVLEVPFKPLVVNPLTVSVNRSGKKRLILDLRHINQYIWKEKMRFEDVKLALEYVKKGTHMFKFDLTSGYHHIDNAPEHQTFLGFSLNQGNNIKYYVFTVLPFGLSSSGFIFTKVLRELVKYWRIQGIKIIVYLDDGWSVNSSFHQTYADSDLVRTSLDASGFLTNNEKSVWVPSQTMTWLGHYFDLKAGVLKITQERVDNLKSAISEAKSKKRVTARHLAKITGMIASMHFVIGQLGRLMTRSLYAKVMSSSYWDSFRNIEPESPEWAELCFWSDNIDNINIKQLFPVRTIQGSISVYSDASDVACAAFSPHIAESIAHKTWSDSEKHKSSTWRELKCIEWGIRALSNFLSDKRVQWFTDNQNCEVIVNAGSSKPDLHSLALSIFSFCKEKSIDLSILWVPRSKNEIADFFSRLIDEDDWCVSDDFFHFINSLWGPFTIDRFANVDNRKIIRFNSKFWNPESEAIDALSQNWLGENNWLVPPVCLASKCILHLIDCQASGTLIVPKWPSAAFWPLVFADEICTWRDYVSDALDFNNSEIIIPGNNKKSLFGSGRFNGPVLAIKFDARSK